jgi:hypothetical protein
MAFRGETGMDALAQKAALRRLEEDSMDSEIATILPARRHERWFDICFRLIILALAGFWLLTPPAGGQAPAVDIKAAHATR